MTKMKMTDSKSCLMLLPNMNTNARSMDDAVNHISTMFCSNMPSTTKTSKKYNAERMIRSSVARTLVVLARLLARSLRRS